MLVNYTDKNGGQNECILDRILDRNRNVAVSEHGMSGFAFRDAPQYGLNLL